VKAALHVSFFLQLATQRLLRCKLQEKLLRVTWPVDITNFDKSWVFDQSERAQDSIYIKKAGKPRGMLVKHEKNS